MNLNKFTIKSQGAIQKAVEIAQSLNNQSIEPAHLLKGILLEATDVTDYLFGKIGVNGKSIDQVLENQLKVYPKVSGGEPYLSSNANKALQNANIEAQKNGDQFTSIEYLLLGITMIKDDTADLLKDNNITSKTLKNAIEDLRKGAKVSGQSAEDAYNALNRYAINLNQQAQSGKLDPVIGRDEEIRRILQILTRRTKNNPILIGEPGVGKTAIAEGLAHRIISGDVPENLKSKIVFSLDMGALIAGAKYKGEFEERLKAVVKEVIDSDGEIIMFIDEIHTLVGAGKGEGAMDAANILKPALARGELRAIGATTLNEYQKFFEKDKALERRFQIVMVDEPDVPSSISILRGLRERYENHHKVQIKDAAILSAVELSHRYITDRFLPDKAIDLIDEAASLIRLEMNSVPKEIDDIERKIKQLEIEREALKRDGDTVKAKKISKDLSDLTEQRDSLRAKWKSEKEIIDHIQLNKEHLEKFKQEAENAEREGNYGLVAEIRYGKIKEVEAEIDRLVNKLEEKQADKGLIREEVNSEDIAEIVSKWTGIPVSKMLQSEKDKLLKMEDRLHNRVIGQDEAIVAISDAVRRSRAGLQDANKPIGSFIFLGTTGVGKTELAKALAEFLFDDENMMTRIDMSEYQEKHSVSRLIGAPPGYVGYDESGQLTEAVRRKPYSVVLLDEIEKAHPDVFNILLQVLEDGRLTDNKGRTVNFKNTIVIMTSNLGSHLIQQNLQNKEESNYDEVYDKTRNELFELLKQTIRPEFLNRIDEIIMFRPLIKKDMADIVDLQLEYLKKRLMENEINFQFDDSLTKWIVDNAFDPQFGARPLKRFIQRNVTNELSKLIIADKINVKSPLMAKVTKEGIKIENL